MAKTPQRKTINLALQGGGSHGAYAWGVIDQLLEDGRIDIEAICATSAGTMNACAFAYGLHKGGRDMARETLNDFWWNVSQAGRSYAPFHRLPWENLSLAGLAPHWNDHSLSYSIFDAWTRVLSPYQFNPFDFNPLRDVLEKTIDFAELQKCSALKLFISATHVKTGRVRVFNASELTIDVALASACLPFLFKAVTVEDEHYWDGGYMGNPALFPLFYETETRDVLIVHINPLDRENLPDTANEIMNRVNEISFNSSLIKELRAIAFVKKLLDNDMLRDEYKDNFKNVLVHALRADEVMKDYSVASKFDTDWAFLTRLRDKGREAMAAWLDEHFEHIGRKDTVDVQGEYLASANRLFEKRAARPVKKVAAGGKSV